MKQGSRLTAQLIALLIIPSLCRANSLPDLSGFNQPISKCVKPAADLIITQTGTFPDTVVTSKPLQIVATAQPNNNHITITDHAALMIFDDACHLLYQQVFPGAGEATFEIIQWDNQPILHLVTVSAVGEPADDTIYNQFFFTQNYDGSLLPVQPPYLTADKNLSIFVGNIGHGQGFGIVETFQKHWPPNPPMTIPFSVMFRLKDVQLPEGQWITAFVGPNLIHAPPGKDNAAAWPDTSYQTGFPLMHYLLGNPFG